MGYLLLGDELHSWRGALIALLLVWGAVEVIVALTSLAHDGWTWQSGVRGLLSFGAVLTGLVLARDWRWVVVAGLVIGLAALRGRFFPSEEVEAE